MSDAILLTGDQVLFDATFAAATVTVQPGALSGSGATQIGGLKVCVLGDEAEVQVAGCPYFVGASYPTPGTGTLSIQALAPDQIAQRTSSGHKSALLKGGRFIAQFQVTSPASITTPSGDVQTDPLPLYIGTGQFQTGDARAKGT